MLIGNEHVAVALDERAGRLVGLRHTATGADYLEAFGEALPEGLRYVLAVVVRLANGAFVTALPPEDAMVSSSGDAATIVFDHLVTPVGALAVRAAIQVRTQPDDEQTLWSLELENGSDATIHEVLFPRIVGVQIGDDPAACELIYPYHAGERTRNPAVEYAGPEFLGSARNGVSLELMPVAGGGTSPVYARECNYLGSASMMWMDYHDGTQGLYVASYDESALVTGVRVETGGSEMPWMGFGFRKHLAVRPGETWRSQRYAVGIHQGDWHWAADRYRAWATGVMRFPEPPAWFLDDPIINPHYDFKSQSGRVTHRFRDIPAVHERARRHGFNHLLFAGWNRMGFDASYAEYFPDMELGTQVELRDACREVVSAGGKITFYINCRIFNTDSDYGPSIVEPAASRDREGALYREEYGTQRFAVMCPDCETWRGLTGDFAYWMIDVYGATGVYLDQIGSAPAVPCYATGHDHDAPGTFNQGYLKLLTDVHRRVKERRPEAFLMIENCGDAYGQFVDAHLTWMPSADAGKRDRYWAVFKYTFPECRQVNMIPHTLGAEGELDRRRAILIGSAFWLRAEADELPREVQDAVSFRRAINHVVAHGRFSDTVGLRFARDAVEATRFDLDGTLLVLAWNGSERDQLVEVDLRGGVPRGVRRVIMGSDAEWERLVGVSVHGGRLRLAVPPGQLCAIEITTSA